MDRNKYTRPELIMGLELRNNKGELKIPDVQRELVWTKSQKQLLIDSLLKDYDIPKLYFVEKLENGKVVYDVIDGQQRLNAIFDFIQDKYSMPKDADPINGEDIANKTFSAFSSELQTQLKSRSLDVVYLQNYNKEEIDETFLRLQNGTPLKAAEKRRAIFGEMRNVIKELSQNPFFEKCCDFDNSHYGYEDITTKVLKQIDLGIGSISAQALAKYYEDNPNIDINNPNCKKVKSAYNFLVKAFKDINNPHLKKFSALDLPVIANGLLNTYDLSSYSKQFGEVYLNFLNERVLNSEKSEEEQNPELQAYSNAARADSIENLKYRQDYLRNYFILNMPYLVVKDKQRLFTPEQRAAIYRLGKGVCAICGKHVDEDSDYHADHIIPWSKGGDTKIANGQLLCANCNLSKGNRED